MIPDLNNRVGLCLIKQDELSPETKEQLPEEERPRPQRTWISNPNPIETDILGVADQTDALPTAVPESGSSDQLTEGGGNQN